MITASKMIKASTMLKTMIDKNPTINVFSATAEYNDSLLALLADNGMAGKIDMVLTRSPDYFARQHYFGHEQPILCEEQGQILGMSQLTRHRGFVNGQPCELGYLNSLRIHRQARHRIRILKAGFDYIRQALSPPAICYTSIASDNTPARRLLEQGVTGLPTYHFVGELSTLAICQQRANSLNLWRLAQQDEYPLIVDFYHQQVAKYQLSPQLSVDWIQQSGLPVLIAVDHHQQLIGCAMIWDQRSFKQVIAQHYHPLYRLLRPFYNLYAQQTRRVQLPALKQPLPQSFLAFFACRDADLLLPLVTDALNYCQTPILTFGLASSHPALAELIKQLKPIIYKTRLYRVDLAGEADWLADNINPEAAIL